jgi:hypothetical protein
LSIVDRLPDSLEEDRRNCFALEPRAPQELRIDGDDHRARGHQDRSEGGGRRIPWLTRTFASSSWLA